MSAIFALLISGINYVPTLIVGTTSAQVTSVVVEKVTDQEGVQDEK